MDIDRTYVVGDKQSLARALTQVDYLKNNFAYPVKLRVSPYRRAKRSYEQNNMFWAWMNEISQHTGHSTEEMHDYFCMKFLGKEAKETLDETVEKIKGTRNLTPKAMADFLTQIQVFCIERLNLTLDNQKNDETNLRD